MAYGGSQARGQIWATAANLCHNHSNVGSLTHWARPGIESTTSWFLVRFVSHWATTGTPYNFLNKEKNQKSCENDYNYIEQQNNKHENVKYDLKIIKCREEE